MLAGVQLEGAADDRPGRRRKPPDEVRRPRLTPLPTAGDRLPRAALRLAVLLVRHAALVPVECGRMGDLRIDSLDQISDSSSGNLK